MCTTATDYIETTMTPPSTSMIMPESSSIVKTTTTTTTTTTATTTSSSVSFAPFVDVYDVLHIDDYSDSEIADCWFSDKEEELIHLEIRNTRMIMGIRNNNNNNTNNSCHVDSDLVCTRGLEEVMEEDDINTIISCPSSPRPNNKKNNNSNNNKKKRTRKMIQDDVFNAVMDEQDIQFAQGICDADRIAAICLEKTRGCQALARTMGEADQQWVINNIVLGSCSSHTTATAASRERGGGLAAKSSSFNMSLDHSQHRRRAASRANILLHQFAGDKKRE